MRALCKAVCLSLVAFVIGVPLLFSETQETIIDNAKVRVLRVVLAPGDTPKSDNPNLDRVVVWLKEGRGKTYGTGHKVLNEPWGQYEARWLDGDDSCDTCQIWSGSKARVPAIVIELKGKGSTLKAANSPQNPWLVDPVHYKIDFENENVRVTRVRIGPRESTPLHEHSLNRIVIYLTPMDFQIDPEGKPSEHSAQKAGAVVWGVPARHTEHNLSDKAFEAVVIEPKF